LILVIYSESHVIHYISPRSKR